MAITVSATIETGIPISMPILACGARRDCEARVGRDSVEEIGRLGLEVRIADEVDSRLDAAEIGLEELETDARDPVVGIAKRDPAQDGYPIYEVKADSADAKTFDFPIEVGSAKENAGPTELESPDEAIHRSLEI